MGIRGIFAVALASCALSVPVPASAQQPAFACDMFGVGWLYIPGSDVCLELNTGYTKELTPDGEINQPTNYVARIETLEQRFDDAFEGAAISTAMPTPFIQEGDNFAFAGNWGSFSSAHALAVAGAARINDNLSLSAGLGVGLGHGNVGAKAGFNLSW